MEVEIWKPVVGYEGLYEVSNMGRVRSRKRGAIRKPRLGKYLRVNLSKNNIVTTKDIHRLVAIHFIPNPNNLPQVNHKKGIKTDNRASELEWVTNRENVSHRFKKTGKTSKHTGVCWHMAR